MSTGHDISADAPRQKRRSIIAALACIGLVAIFTINAWLAVSTKSATFDETAHAPAAYTHLRYNDFRMNPEHPPLWKFYAAIPWLFDPPTDMRLHDPDFAIRPNVWSWAQNVLFHTPGNDGLHLLALSRFFMLLLGSGLCALTGWFAWRAAGPVAAIIATALVAFDPNLLAHAPLVTNDVSLALVTLAIVFCLWRCGQALTRTRIAALSLLCAAAVTTKFTGVLLGPVVAIVLLIRALSDVDWRLGNRVLSSRLHRVGAVVSICLFCAVVSYLAIWTAYGFRFTVSPDGGIRPDFAGQLDQALTNRIQQRTGAPATAAQKLAEPAGATLATLRFVHSHKLLPEAFLTGAAFVYANSFNRMSFFMGEVSGGGNILYFPVAIAVKTPIATLLLVAASVVAFALQRRTRDGGNIVESRWLWICLFVPLAILFFASVTSPLNIGIRHILHLYPLAYVFAGVVLARAIGSSRRLAFGVVALFIVVAIETLALYPNYLAYFNVAAGGPRGGERILGDSNLDWGQDLPAIARWERAHPDQTLYLAYFGTAEPSAYGVRAEPITLGTDFVRTTPTFPDRGTVAVSVTMLHAKWKRDEAAAFFRALRDREPDGVLGGSIYLFELGPER